ncbi:MAG: TonB-dependent receptor [Saprospiraceae bacterium]
MLLRLFTIISILATTFYAVGQTSGIKGRVINIKTNEPIAYANVFVANTTSGALTDTNGYYVINTIPPGIYTLTCSFIGFKSNTIFEIQVTSVKYTTVDFELDEDSRLLDEIQIVASPFNKTEESPLSIRTIGSTEIFRSPGGNRDISKVIQILPGIGSTVSFRNDIIVRGGAPNENRFFIDGIEVPNINHFATQGSSGGPVGLINVNFIQQVDFYSGAFPANRGNGLSSIAEFKLKKGNDEKLTGTAMLGSSDIGVTLDGPIGKKSSFIFSARRSYLQLLFKAIGLPFLPTYNDFQLKQSIQLNQKSSITIIGLGAIDDFKLNKSVNDGINDSTTIDRNNYILGYLPVNTQWNYTIGAVYKILSQHGYLTFVVSRNHLDNTAKKFVDNLEVPENKVLDYNSSEIENKIRIENTSYTGGWKLNAGIGYENARYTNSTFRKIEYQGRPIINNFNSTLAFQKFSAFAQASHKYFDDRLVLSAGVRTDFNSYSPEMTNPIKQLSPRLSTSYTFTPKWSVNFNTGRYYQLPAYTVMGYRDSSTTLINKENKIRYVQSDQMALGIEYDRDTYSKITLEGFYKNYAHYPFLLKDSISLANLGGDFGVIGNEEAISMSEGRSYGIEFLAQQKLSSSIYGLISYTFFKSEFRDKTGKYRPSSWDNRHILNLVVGKRFSKNWEVGMKFRLLGGSPYTPYDLALSSKKEIWDITNQGVSDWSRLNENRNPLTHTLDVRVDKKWFFKKWSVNVYLDVQNLYNFQAEGQPYLNVSRDSLGNPITNVTDPSSYNTYLIKNTIGTLLPSIGIMVEF